ncbi:MAG: RNA chaperone Hfq [Saccharofermentanales bacterium]
MQEKKSSANTNDNSYYDSSSRKNEKGKIKVQDVPYIISAPSSESIAYNGSSRLKINNMQDSFLNNCRHDHTIVEIHLIGNITDTGVIVGFDMNTLIMEYEDKSQYLIMKSAIIKIIPKKRVNYIFNDNYKCPNFIADYSGNANIGG